MDYKEKLIALLNDKDLSQEQKEKLEQIFPLEQIFSELKESEDERIRKAIIGGMSVLKEQYKKTFFSIPIDDCITWLEKQGQQKSVDKVEPKFHEGDFITDGERIFQIEETVWEKNNRNDGITYCESFIVNLRDGITYANNTDLKQYHLWTIKDAKDGDVLAVEDKVFIYNGKLDLRGRVCAYCGIYKTYDGLRFTECGIGNYFTYEEPHPATKEQRDLLFSKMKEAGWEFDFEKKKLKKISQRMISAEVKEAMYNKPAWSEEDEEMFNTALDMIEWYSGKNENKSRAVSNWLKSLRHQNRWKPSDEQLEALRIARSFVTDDFDENPTLSDTLVELEEQLKVLKL